MLACFPLNCFLPSNHLRPSPMPPGNLLTRPLTISRNLCFFSLSHYVILLAAYYLEILKSNNWKWNFRLRECFNKVLFWRIWNVAFLSLCMLFVSCINVCKSEWTHAAQRSDGCWGAWTHALAWRSILSMERGGASPGDRQDAGLVSAGLGTAGALLWEMRLNETSEARVGGLLWLYGVRIVIHNDFAVCVFTVYK